VKVKSWFKRHEVLIDFLLHIPWMVWRTFLNILDRIREEIKESLAFRAVKRFFEFFNYFFAFLLLVAAGTVLYIFAFFTDSKRKRPKIVIENRRISLIARGKQGLIMILALVRDAAKAVGLIVFMVLLIGLVCLLDPKYAFSIPKI